MDAAERLDAVDAQAVARRALDEAGGDWRRAAAIFRAWIDTDGALYRALLDPFIDQAVWAAVRAVARADRRAFFPGGGPKEDDAGDVKALGLGTLRSLYEYPLMGGKRLGDATREELVEMVEMHRTFAKANALKARWFSSICRRVKDGKTVRECLTEADLEALQAEAGAR